MKYKAKYDDGSVKIVEANDMYNAYLMCCTENSESNITLVELKKVDEDSNKE